MFAEQARKMKMEEEDKIRQLEDKWSKSYEEKSIVADQLERELTTTVIALDEIKIDRERTEKR